jgi:hypothetical protein
MPILCRQLSQYNDEEFHDELSEEDNQLLDNNYDNIIIFKLNENNRLQEEIIVI